MTVTAEDRTVAAALMAALDSADLEVVAALLAQVRTTAISCAVVRMDREYRLAPKKRAPSARPRTCGTCGKGFASAVHQMCIEQRGTFR